MAASIQQQLHMAQGKVGSSPSGITEDDILSLALSSLMNCQTRSINDFDNVRHRDESIVPQKTFETVSASLNKMSYETNQKLACHASINGMKGQEIDSSTHSELKAEDLNYNIPYQCGDLMASSSIVTQQHHGLDISEVLHAPGQKVHGASTVAEKYPVSPPEMMNLSVLNQPDLFTFDPPTGVDQNCWSHFDLPLSTPYSDLGRLCMAFRDQGRQLLAQGITLQELGCYGRMDCELLFRDRTLHDALNLPNWACEVSIPGRLQHEFDNYHAGRPVD